MLVAHALERYIVASSGEYEASIFTPLMWKLASMSLHIANGGFDIIAPPKRPDAKVEGLWNYSPICNIFKFFNAIFTLLGFSISFFSSFIFFTFSLFFCSICLYFIFRYRKIECISNDLLRFINLVFNYRYYDINTSYASTANITFI